MKALIYTKGYCPYCKRAKQNLKDLGIPFEEIDVTTDKKLQDEMIKRSGGRTVPQIFLSIGGSDDLEHFRDTGALNPFLEA